MIYSKIDLQKKSLPEDPGIYKFFDKSNNIIYVGKAKNLKKRVLSYFNKNHVNHKTELLVKQINKIENIVVETDSPYLSPTPHRGKRNESSYITYVIDKLSDIYGLSNSDIISQTSLNANDVFDFNN